MQEILSPYLPKHSIEYCIQLSRKYDFRLDFSFNRKSKFGHYKYLPQSKTHIISINKGLTKPLFLITYLHELAHLEVMIRYKRRVKPHGLEWKQTFASFLSPLLNEHVFEPLLLNVLSKHLKNPKASLSADHELWEVLMNTDLSQSTKIKDIKIEEHFIFKKRVFKKLKTRRTRALCLEPSSGNQYLIPLIATVEKVN